MLHFIKGRMFYYKTIQIKDIIIFWCCSRIYSFCFKSIIYSNIDLKIKITHLTMQLWGTKFISFVNYVFTCFGQYMFNVIFSLHNAQFCTYHFHLGDNFRYLEINVFNGHTILYWSKIHFKTSMRHSSH